MNNARKKKVSLEDVFKEVQALRREVSVFVSYESIDDYKNKKEIMDAYRTARRHIVQVR
ncbi:MAG: hypothetical protein UY68_C0008G0032 [Parcubacteria group bacterium GW2011_GWF2_52_12]|nr:MAG: hypothetical protein UY66_C0015G0009 [Parcubacteria group bacterium GW2011_GWC1_51_35]KKW24757.1 MAG: hypothetical protein UY68_C0008G0032 [Parcubacteria group bacterium GW2011_GWF2_52_12]KKW27920.1 MAG: hypothetical protein UY69_C0003G0014 [Parcubacteria group bacterium GW2011_GWF1_52_5]KKW34480.1 MAG: hypothetical protein UY80_C0019G0011 [Parcubacteria group bacterium GW2011_GWB1_53_43]